MNNGRSTSIMKRLNADTTNSAEKTNTKGNIILERIVRLTSTVVV